MSFLQRLSARLAGRAVGTDRFGNTYYESAAKQPVYDRTRRWVVYKGAPDPTSIPPEWHAWMHHTVDAPLSEVKRYAWQKEHRPNLTGTPASYRPAGHDYAGGQRRATAGDYDAWTPGS
ncbi:NADH:ubiquinone oxidoreductase subunit NDUFA12 [Roseomonas sp. NAR14]|uniref:NADH:ubiquinone oxidoreductase subunit NDUFA12 n=1 Tax=Roseomonas acroporae TaxID=2937791 RepID=A0A9X1Y7Y8_9PROT|nr:NADH:ubiquinone oxidoreductase subunit NDUFA12 [Roseomonas acroporae]MCK8783890.1 NADH:ubiquinone oxidoreductase subunit NDUFA12 [Roseomonas acroporae]